MSAPEEQDEVEDKLLAPYKVGYGRPPVQHRFRKGVSGNPQGRPKGSQNKPKVDTRVGMRGAEAWHWEQRMFDIINDAVSDRYKARLENRSYRDGASREGTALDELRANRDMREQYVS